MSTPGVPGGALPFSGPLDLAKINAEWGLGTDLTQYHGVRWYYDGNLTTGLFGGNTIKVSDFYGKRATDPAGAGAYFANTAGSGSFIVPLYRNYIKIEVWGGGGSGGDGDNNNGEDGGDSNILGVTVGGGQGGKAGYPPIPAQTLLVDAPHHQTYTQISSGDQNGFTTTSFFTNGTYTGSVTTLTSTGEAVLTQGDTQGYGTDATTTTTPP